MKRCNIQVLQCPACRKQYELNSLHSAGEKVEEGFLTCPQCCITIPIVSGFPLFAEQFLTRTPDLGQIANRVFGRSEEYLAFLDAKQDKPAWDLYAAFQPFNESTQALFPLIGLFQTMLKPGDLILDLWWRTGWSGELLAAVFPEQQVISVWESYAGVLGAKGFHHWLGSGKRRPNLDVIFHSPNNPLPFADRSFAIVHGLDTLHRYHHVPLIAECRRVVSQEGAIFFPHCHLTNSEPEPYFDRGEDQLHGREYEEFFARLFAGTTWKGYVLSEKKLFDAEDQYVLEDEPDTTHYNAAILLTDKKHEGKVISAVHKTLSTHEGAHVILNPLYDIDLNRREVRPAAEAMDGGATELFYRHPIYQQRLLQRSPIPLSEQQTMILYWAQRSCTVSEIAARTASQISTVLEELVALERREVVQVQNVSAGMARLQFFYAAQRTPAARGEATLTALWQRAQLLHHDKTFLIWPEDDSRFSYGDSDRIVRMTATYLSQKGIKEGDRVILISEPHPEFLFLFWATILLGAVAIPISDELNEDAFNTIVEKSGPRLIFAPASFYTFVSQTRIPVVVFGCNEESEFYPGSFSEALPAHPPAEALARATDNQEAVILFTSGSTGKPKGVVLTHGSLYRSSEIMDREYGWRSSDIFLGVAGLHTMSGLRNPCLAALLSGLAVVLPNKEQVHNPMAVMNLALQYDVTLLNTGPAFLSYWNRVSSQKAAYFKDHSLRMILCTGSSLHAVHRDAFEKKFGCPVYDYYGLTETSGVCILINKNLDSIEDKGIGRACGCLIRIVGEEGNTLPPGEAGELAIYGENLMKEYLGDAELTSARIQNGWFFTGDTALINPDGCVLLFGRKDRMLIDKSGENLYPEEIERELNKIEGVVESYVTGYQDASMVSQIAAVVSVKVTGLNADQLEARIRACLSASLPAQRIPALFLFVKEIPKSAGGKVAPEAVRQCILEAIANHPEQAGSRGELRGDRGFIPTN